MTSVFNISQSLVYLFFMMLMIFRLHRVIYDYCTCLYSTAVWRQSSSLRLHHYKNYKIVQELVITGRRRRRVYPGLSSLLDWSVTAGTWTETTGDTAQSAIIVWLC